MKLEVRTLTEDEWPLWDDFVDKSPQGTVFHKCFWLKASGRKCVIYGCFTGAELFAGVAVSCRKIFGIKVASQPQDTRYSGVLFKGHDSKYVTKLSAEKEAYQKIAQRLKRDFDLVRFPFPSGPVNLQPFIWEGFSPSIKYTYIIQLDKSLEDIWKEMDEKRKGNIRKAEKDGISVAPSDDFDQAFNLIQKTFTRHKVSIQSKPVIFSHNKVLTERNQCKSFLAKDKNNNYIAAGYIVWDNKRSHYLYAGINYENVHNGAAALVTWKAIEFSKKELGLKEFDFQGSMIPDIERFIRGFGGQQTVQYVVTWVKPYLRIVLFTYEVKCAISSWLRLNEDGENEH